MISSVVVGSDRRYISSASPAACKTHRYGGEKGMFFKRKAMTPLVLEVLF
jgi:hypothetical protein